MTGPTLGVDTAAIRRAADVVDQAAAAFAGTPGSGHREPSPLIDASLGPSEIARAVVAAAGDRLIRSQDAALGLADRTRTMAGSMQTAATAFDVVDSLIGAPR